MTKRNRLARFDLPDDQIQQELAALFGSTSEDWCPTAGPTDSDNRVIEGRVLRVSSEEVWIDVGAKCPGVISLREWDEASPQVGDAISVLVVSNDDATGTVVMSRREAVRWQRWADVIARYREGDRVQGVVTHVVRGGLIVDIGYEAFLPASQVDIRRPPNLADYVGLTIECSILRIDPARRSIIVSRRLLVETSRPMETLRLSAAFEVGQIRAGVVKNIAEFGAFVDLGGIDGLLHVSDMCWGRSIDPHRHVALEQRLEVVLLRVDREKEKIGLGLPVKAVPATWLSPTVVNVARGILEENHWDCLPILADALDDAGCNDIALLSQLRGPLPCECAGLFIASLLAAPGTSG